MLKLALSISCLAGASEDSSGCADGEVRLAGGSVANEGVVEVCLNGVWSTVCAEDWDTSDAIVTCSQLGYNGSSSTSIVPCHHHALDLSITRCSSCFRKCCANYQLSCINKQS